MSKAHFAIAVVGLVALLSAGVLATASIDEALAAAGVVDETAASGDASPQPTKGTPQWNS